MRNQYPGVCGCGVKVAKGRGYFEFVKSTRVSRVRCMKCVVAGKLAKEKPLSGAQSDWLRNWEAKNG